MNQKLKLIEAVCIVYGPIIRRIMCEGEPWVKLPEEVWEGHHRLPRTRLAYRERDSPR